MYWLRPGFRSTPGCLRLPQGWKMSGFREFPSGFYWQQMLRKITMFIVSKSFEINDFYEICHGKLPYGKSSISMHHFSASPVKSDRREYGVAPSCPQTCHGETCETFNSTNPKKRYGNSQSHWKGDFLCSDRLHFRLQIWNATIYIDHIIFQKQMLDIWISESSSWPRPFFFFVLTLCEGDGVSKMEAAGDSLVGRWHVRKVSMSW